MAPLQHKPSPLSPQLLAGTTRKLRDRFAFSGDALLSSGLRYGLLTFYVAIVYVLVLALSGVTNERSAVPWWLNVIALLIIVPTLPPVHGALRRSLNQLVYGQHDNPYALLSQLNQSMDGSTGSDAVLPSLAATLAATLKLPYVAIATEAAADHPVTSYGAPPPHTEILSIPLSYRTSTLGTLRVSSRHPHERLSADDLRLLADLARQVGMTLHAAQLSDALQASREQLVTAREEERRRIRRDLHDGLGPMLAGLRMQLSALRHSVHDDPLTEALIDSLRDDVRAATADIRRLVYDLRPPLLDEHGLLGAIRHLGSALESATLTLDAPATLPPLPAAVEVAVYRIAAEAVQNVAKHAQASSCAISVVLSKSMLALQVADNGAGVPADYVAGVGLHSMRERAAELGGQLTIEPMPGGGTCVLATIPCEASQ
ncbi:MAG: GAF domain-containing sensor histidine kinase [Chloroflexota bacterium]|nr:GAF domain-containing sensor histidine kinase [Chloroflexota bacterium]